MTELIEFDRNAPLDWGAVAIIHRSLDALIVESGLSIKWQHRRLEGGWLREVGLRLTSGRLAYLDETRTAPNEFTLHLVRHRDRFFVRDDFDEVRQYLIHKLGLTDHDVTVLTGQVQWWKKKPPVTPRGEA